MRRAMMVRHVRRGSTCHQIATDNKNGESRMMRIRRIEILGIVVLGLAVASGVAGSAQDKYTLKLPDGVAFSDFRGYEDWQYISSSKTDDRMKVILGNPTIIAAFKS